jgi:hypothetical protein
VGTFAWFFIEVLVTVAIAGIRVCWAVQDLLGKAILQAKAREDGGRRILVRIHGLALGDRIERDFIDAAALMERLRRFAAAAHQAAAAA